MATTTTDPTRGLTDAATDLGGGKAAGLFTCERTDAAMDTGGAKAALLAVDVATMPEERLICIPGRAPYISASTLKPLKFEGPYDPLFHGAFKPRLKVCGSTQQVITFNVWCLSSEKTQWIMLFECELHGGDDKKLRISKDEVLGDILFNIYGEDDDEEVDDEDEDEVDIEAAPHVFRFDSESEPGFWAAITLQDIWRARATFLS